MEAEMEPRKRKSSRPSTKAKKSPAPSASEANAETSCGDAAMMEAWQKSMTPGKFHERLEPLVGTFDVKVKMWMQPGQPASEGGGKSVHKWMLGGRFLQQIYRGKAMGMPFQGLGYTGYDNVLQKYVGTWMDNMGTGIMNSVELGKSTAKKIEFESSMADPMSGAISKLRTAIRIKDQDNNSFEMWASGPDGNEFKTMQIDYKRA